MRPSLRSVLHQGECKVMVGAFNGLVGRAVAEAGFDACYVSGACVSACAGQPDIGLMSYEQFARTISEVSLSSGLPVLADADTGFGEEEMVAKTVCEYWRAGAGGFHMEDQVFPKRCGHLADKRVIPLEHMVEKVRMAARARDQFTGGEFVVCARTDAVGVEGLEAGIQRAKAYVDAGADMIFPDALSSIEQLEAFGRELGGRTFLLGNMTEFGKTPVITVEQFKAMGYHLVMFPVSTLRIAMKSVTEFLSELKRNGSQAESLEKMQTRQELYRLLQYTPGQTWQYPTPARPSSR